MVKDYGMICRVAGAVVTPRMVTVNDRLPVGSPSGSRTTMYDSNCPVIPGICPTFSTGKFTPFACTDNVDVSGIGGETIPTFDVNKIMRV